jgi:hypothetical protein
MSVVWTGRALQSESNDLEVIGLCFSIWPILLQKSDVEPGPS